MIISTEAHRLSGTIGHIMAMSADKRSWRYNVKSTMFVRDGRTTHKMPITFTDTSVKIGKTVFDRNDDELVVELDILSQIGK